MSANKAEGFVTTDSQGTAVEAATDGALALSTPADDLPITREQRRSRRKPAPSPSSG
jgi:hypothetical protein